MTDLHHLRTFLVVGELEHLTRAAERLHLSQPAASAHIKSLEQELGVALFERRATGLSLTHAGRELMGFAREVLAASVALRSRAREIASRIGGRLRLGVRADTELPPLGILVHVIREAYPELELELFRLSTLNIMAGIRDGDLDAGLTLIGQMQPGLQGVALGQFAYRVVAPAAWRHLVIDAAPTMLARLPWIGAPRGGSHDQMLISILGNAGLALNRVIESDHEEAHATLVESGVGLALMREDRIRAAVERGAVVACKVRGAQSTLWYLYAESHANDPMVRAVQDLAVDIWSGGAALPSQDGVPPV